MRREPGSTWLHTLQKSSGSNTGVVRASCHPEALRTSVTAAHVRVRPTPRVPPRGTKEPASSETLVLAHSRDDIPIQQRSHHRRAQPAAAAAALPTPWTVAVGDHRCPVVS
ncbi:uncharacterized protein LOC144936854 [Lampetra fluviatilis]